MTIPYISLLFDINPDTATYGYLDGEYIFSAALLLVMVNAAFPHNETNARAMETALNLLRSMADRGNTYLASRHSLLLELRAAIGPKTATSHARRMSQAPDVPVTPRSDQLASPAMPQTNPQHSSTQGVPEDWQPLVDLPSLQDISFQFDLNDDPALWEGALDQIDIDMDTDWIESTLKR